MKTHTSFKQITLSQLQPIGRGATANVYKLEKNKILKLFKQNYSKEAVNYEASIAAEINELDIAAPCYYETCEIDGRHGIIYEYIDGPLLFSRLITNYFKAPELIKKMAEKLFQINRNTSSELPKQSNRLMYFINSSSEPLVQKHAPQMKGFLGRHSADNFVCHADLHAGNIISSKGDFITIDWMNCYSGSREGDVLRSYLMLISPFIPIKLNPFQHILFIAFKKYMGHMFLKHYLKLSGLKKRDIFKWWPVIAAVRLSDNVPGEKKWLLNKIIRYIDMI